LISVGGKTMLARVIERIAPQVERLVLNVNGDPGRFASYALPVAPDTIEGFAGPLAGLLAGMRWAEANAPSSHVVATVAADTPFFPLDLVASLSQACGEERTIALAASSDGTHPVFGLWPVRLADELEAFLLGGQGGKILTFADRYVRLNVPFDDIALPGGETVDPFFNVNTPDDVTRATAIAKALDRSSA
jgi:molybdopterin-guanine dinucleotide biosynthesis protein A